MDSIKIAMVGMGAANVATFRLMKSCGVDPASIVACDRLGTLHRDRDDLAAQQAEYPDKWLVCQQTNGERVTGGIAEALRGADVCVAFSEPGPQVIRPEWLRAMANDAILFACANPVPEIWPADAKQAGVRIVATGRSDFPNQVNNSLGFPGIFRGALDVRAATITDEMALAAAAQLAASAVDAGLHEERIVPRMDEWEVVPQVAVATALKAQEQGIARICKSRDVLCQEATTIIHQAREATHLLMREGLIAMPET